MDNPLYLNGGMMKVFALLITAISLLASGGFAWASTFVDGAGVQAFCLFVTVGFGVMAGVFVLAYSDEVRWARRMKS